MTTAEIKEKFETYLNAEVEDLKRSYDDEYSMKMFSAEKLRTHSIKCMLGASQFVQFLGVSYKDVNEIYTKYRDEVDNLCKEYLAK